MEISTLAMMATAGACLFAKEMLFRNNESPAGQKNQTDTAEQAPARLLSRFAVDKRKGVGGMAILTAEGDRPVRGS